MEQTADALLLRRADDLIAANQTRRKAQYLGFLDERQVFLLEAYFGRIGFTDYCFYGGYENAQRCFLAVDLWQEPDRAQFPFVLLEFSYRPQDTLCHRDFLGALMALGLERACIGDVLVDTGKAAVFLEQTVAPYVCEQVQKIGRVGVKIKLAPSLTVRAQARSVQKTGTVSSLRLDAVAALCTGQSREKTKALLTGKQVSLNFQVCQNPSAPVQEGDRIAIRGYGKFVLETVGGSTKKGRIHLTIQHAI